jgi:dTDP-4-dehydrorhamnose reductase
MLTGRVGREHPLWAHLWWLGLTRADFDPMIEDACPPDVIGGNYYITSERFLDHRLDRYPQWTHGGNGKDAYADVEAVRVLDDDLAGPAGMLQEAWARYGLPVAVTEAHLGSAPQEQVRWLARVWESGRSLRESGVDTRAVTVWALLGSFDWSSLCTREDDHYEPGAFDIRYSPPRQTPVARMAKSLADGGKAEVAGERRRGWWERRERLLYPPVNREGRDTRSNAA